MTTFDCLNEILTGMSAKLYLAFVLSGTIKSESMSNYHTNLQNRLIINYYDDAGLLQNSSSRLCCRGLPSTDLKSKFKADNTCSNVDSIVSRYFSVSISSDFESSTGLTPSPVFIFT